MNKIVHLLWQNVGYCFSWAGVLIPSGKGPWFLSVELAAYCNLRCPECPTGRGTLHRQPRDVMSVELFRNLIDENKQSLLHLILYFQGEPTLHKSLLEMIRYAHEAKVFTSISTNAQLLDNDMAKSLVLSGLDKMIVSVDGTTQEVYQQYRVGGKLDKALNAIRSVQHWKRTLNSISPMLELQMIVLKSNEHQIDEMKQLARELGVDRLVFKTAQLYDFEKGHAQMPTMEAFTRYTKAHDGGYVIKNSLPNRCWRVWNGAVVNVKGEVLPCCYDKDSVYKLGRIQDAKLEEIWNQKKASDFRASILKNRKQYEMCRNCTSR